MSEREELITARRQRNEARADADQLREQRDYERKRALFQIRRNRRLREALREAHAERPGSKEHPCQCEWCRLGDTPDE
jgi:hypothetical protein